MAPMGAILARPDARRSPVPAVKGRPSRSIVRRDHPGLKGSADDGRPPLGRVGREAVSGTLASEWHSSAPAVGQRHVAAISADLTDHGCPNAVLVGHNEELPFVLHPRGTSRYGLQDRNPTPTRGHEMRRCNSATGPRSGDRVVGYGESRLAHRHRSNQDDRRRNGTLRWYRERLVLARVGTGRASYERPSASRRTTDVARDPLRRPRSRPLPAVPVATHERTD